nr:hypothetical protein [Tanacetum cinerariifolium]
MSLGILYIGLNSVNCDGRGEDRPPPHHVPSGSMCCFANRDKDKRKPNLGDRAAGRLNTRDKTRNLSLKEITDMKGPVPIQFELRDKQTVMPLGDHAAHWSSYIGERQSSTTQEYPSLIDTFFVAHTVNGEFLRDEDRRIYFESGGASGSGGCEDDEEGADHQDDEDEDGDGDTSLCYIWGSSLKLEKGQKNQEKRGRKFWAGTLCNAQCFKRCSDRDDITNEGFFVGYSLNSKAFRVFNNRTRIMEENLHIRFRKSTPNVIGTKASDNACQARKETEPVKDYILLPLWTADLPFSQDPKSSHDDRSKPSSDDGKKVDEDPRKESKCKDQEKEDNVNNTNNVNTVSSTVNIAGTNRVNVVVADMNNLDTTIQVSPILTTRIHKDHPLDQVIGDLQSATQTRKILKNLEEHGFVSTIQQTKNHKDLQNYFFACFLSQEEPKKVIQALKDPSWIEAMQEELLQFKLQEILTLVDLPNGKRAIGSKWVLGIKRMKGEFSTKKKLCISFERLMHEKFLMSSIGELTFFLGLQVKQKKDGIFISQDKYVAEILKNIRFTEVKTASTPMETQKPFLKDKDREEVDVHMYRLMIGSLTYLTSSRPDIMFVVCAYARYQVNPKVSHLYAMKRIFSDLVKFSKLIMFALDPFIHTLSNEIHPKCHMGLGVRSVGSVIEMDGKGYGTVGCRKCWGRCTVNFGG